MQPALISYRDSKKYPSEALAIQAWTSIAEGLAGRIVCGRFDPGQFARALQMCRRLTQGPQGLQRMIVTCAASGVAVVIVPAFAGCHLSSASQWLIVDKHGHGLRAMIALSIRYRRDDQLYFSLFREAGAILAAAKMGSGTIGRNGPDGCCAPMVPDPILRRFDPDAFARDFIVPPECAGAGRLAEITRGEEVLSADSRRSSQPSPVRKSARIGGNLRIEPPGSASAAKQMSAAIEKLAAELVIAPGLLVGRLQHDGYLSWQQQNHLKREVDLSAVLASAQAAQETWPDQSMATRAVMRDLSVSSMGARLRVLRAAERGELLARGHQRQTRLEPGELAAWRLKMRDRDLDAEDREDAA